MCFGNGVKIPSKAYFLLIRSSFISEFFVLIYAFFNFDRKREFCLRDFLISAEYRTGGMPGVLQEQMN